MGLFTNTATNEIIVDYPISNVKDAIAFLLKRYSPKYFIPQKNGINNTLGTYVFSRPKAARGTLLIKLTLQKVEENKTKIVFSTTESLSPTNIQTAIMEVENIILAVLQGARNKKLDAILKSNNSGNGCFNYMATCGCFMLLLLGIFIYVILFLDGILQFF